MVPRISVRPIRRPFLRFDRVRGRLLALAAVVLFLDSGLSLSSAQPAPTPAPAGQQDTADKTKPTGQKTKQRSSNPLVPRSTNPNSKMLVQADEMVYDYQNDKVSAVGHAQIYNDGAILEADKVTYDRKTNRLHASGNVIYKAKDGKIIYSDLLELDKDFREGFVNSFLMETPEKTRFAAARADRSDGNLTVYQSGVYTSCEPCKDNPKKPPLWQVKATRIVHNEGEKIIHYENASFEFFGMPVAWFPYFSHPDPTVKRKSGFLAPNFFSTSKIGMGVDVPYFWAMAPNYDTTFSIVPLTRQIGPMVKAEWRHRLVDGAYIIRAAGVFQQDKDAFVHDDGTPEPGYRNFRGEIESSGQFNINKNWNWGWKAALLSDRTFPRDYSPTHLGFTEKTNELYLVGQGDRSYFDIRGMHFIGLSELDRHLELPTIHPVLDYSYTAANPVLGGEFGFRMNFTSLSRERADYDPINLTAADNKLCDARAIIMATNPGNCLMRGIAGDYTRFSSELNWKRTLINGWGQMFMPFVKLRGDVASRDVSNDTTIAGAGAASFIGTEREVLVRAMPTVGMETRWPFISVHSWGTQVIEPIAQLIVRPNETNIGRFPNEDAQSLVFDDTNLFAIDKYSGYDRVEGGARANLGLQYTANMHRYGMVNMMFGQSFHLFGRNSFAYTDTANIGLQSGLEQSASDYVARIYFQPTGNLSFTSRFRFDKDSFALHRFELETKSTWDRLSLSTIYARYDAQPLIGYLTRREGIYQTATLKLHQNWSVTGGIRYDIDRQRVDLGVIGLSYIDECFATTFSYVADYTNIIDSRPIHRFMIRINLRTLGGTGFSTHFGNPVTGPDVN